MLPLSLSYDHRVIDGADAARFTTRLAELLGDLRLPGALVASRTVVVRVPEHRRLRTTSRSSRYSSRPATASSAEQALITIESDKASMEIPSPHAGVVQELARRAKAIA